MVTYSRYRVFYQFSHVNSVYSYVAALVNFSVKH